jgi:hypothetical protein
VVASGGSVLQAPPGGPTFATHHPSWKRNGPSQPERAEAEASSFSHDCRRVKVALLPLRKGAPDYFSEVLIDVNLSLMLEPRPLTMAMIAREMPAAIRPYSIAVAPDSSDKNLRKVRCNFASTEILLKSFTPVVLRTMI